MKIQQTIQKCLDDWNRISGLDFCILDENDQIYISTGDRRLPSSEKLAQFREDPALCISNRSCSLYKLNNIPQSNMLLIVWGSGEQASTIGELAVCQVESLLTAYTEKTDKNSFMQNLLLDRYSQVEAFNKAARLHITPSARRAVFLVETKQHKDENALATIRNIFSARTRDFITALDDSGIIVVRELQSTESYEELEGIACMLVDMLNENNVEFVHVEESDYDSRFLRCVELVKEMMGEQR